MTKKLADFNFKQFTILEILKDYYEDINNLIKKLIISNIQTTELRINHNFFDFFDENLLVYVKKENNTTTFNSSFSINNIQ